MNKRNYFNPVHIYFIIVGALIMISFSFNDDDFVPNLVNPDGRNNPIGKGKGIYPGRVVWNQNFEATSWDEVNGHWWDDDNINTGIVEEMLIESLTALTNSSSSKEAWDKLFKYINNIKGKNDIGYSEGEIIAVKVNLNAIHNPTDKWHNQGYPSPQLVAAMVEQLIEVVGVKGKDIYLVDPSRYFSGPIYKKIISKGSDEFKNVNFIEKSKTGLPNHLPAKPDTSNKIFFNMPDGNKYRMCLAKIFSDADYIINYSLVRPHRVFGITSVAKNHFGSVWDYYHKTFRPNMLHAFAQWDYPTPNKLGDPHSNPVLLGHKTFNAKTILYFADGLYTSITQTGPVKRFTTMNNEWFSSILMSQDPVALESVVYDFISSEPSLVARNPSFNGHQDNQFQEAALANDPPSGVIYDPEGDGIPIIESLGVHEHWNNSKDKQYSRNLGKSRGIELISINKHN